MLPDPEAVIVEMGKRLAFTHPDDPELPGQFVHWHEGFGWHAHPVFTDLEAYNAIHFDTTCGNPAIR